MWNQKWQFLLDNLDVPSDYNYVCHLNKIVGGDNLVINAVSDEKAYVSGWKQENIHAGGKSDYDCIFGIC